LKIYPANKGSFEAYFEKLMTKSTGFRFDQIETSSQIIAMFLGERRGYSRTSEGQ
jgi:hypothetical protein